MDFRDCKLKIYSSSSRRYKVEAKGSKYVLKHRTISNTELLLVVTATTTSLE